MNDNQVIEHIAKLVVEEEQLHSKGNLTPDEVLKVQKLKVELDRYWDFLRQRRSFRNVGQDPNNAEIRPATQ